MKEQVITIFKTRIEELYQESRDLLFDQESYHREVDTANLLHYFNYLESCFKKPYNRLRALATYLNDESTFLVDQAYPIALLKEEIKIKIEDKGTEAYLLAEALNVSGIDPNYESLDQEEFLRA